MKFTQRAGYGQDAEAILFNIINISNMDLKQNIYGLLTRKSFNRDEPYNRLEIQSIIDQSINNHKPIPLVGFWGVGPKVKPNWAYKATLNFLSQYHQDIKDIYNPGLAFHFIFATQHGVHNGINEETIRSYTRQIEELFKERNFTWRYLDELWEKYGISFEKIEKLLSQKPHGWWKEIENHDLIEQNAKSRNHRLPAEEAAQFYFVMRDLEKEMLQKEYNGYIFNTFSDTKLLNVLPSIPMLFLYGRRGWVNAPWFVTEDRE